MAMTLFINQRASPSGGIPAEEASLWDDGDRSVTTDDFERRVRNRDLVLAAHGFNVGRASGVRALSRWAARVCWVLQFAFPIGNPIGQIVMHGHPYFRTALGRNGPSAPIPDEQRGGAWQIPERWDYGRLDYLPGSDEVPRFPSPLAAPGENEPRPIDPDVGDWKPSWSAAVVPTDVA